MAALLETADSFFPFKAYSNVLKGVASLVSLLHEPEQLSRAILITGPQGIGKTRLFAALMNERVLDAMRIKDGTPSAQPGVTYARYVDLCGGVEYSSFVEWVVWEVVSVLKNGTQQQQAARLVICHAFGITQEAAKYTEPEKFTSENILSAIRMASSTKEGSRPELNALNFWSGLRSFFPSTEMFGPLQFLSQMLRACKTCLLCIVDESEKLFLAEKCLFTSAATWLKQMHSLLRMTQSAIGLALCASFQRARQLFLKDNSEHIFPAAYQAHLSLRSDWNSSKLLHYCMAPPVWHTLELALFILMKSVNVRFSSLSGAGDSDVTSSSSCASSQQSSASSGSGSRSSQSRSVASGSGRSSALSQDVEDPSPLVELQIEAARLDSIFLRAATIEKHSSTNTSVIEASLELFLHIFGSTPRRVVAGVRQLQFLSPECQWPLYTRHEAMSEGPTLDEHAVTAFDAFCEGRTDMLRQLSHLNFNSNPLAINRMSLLERVKLKLCAVGSVPTSSLQQAAVRCVDAALDSGFLGYQDDGLISLPNPNFFTERVCMDLHVHPAFVAWLTHPGYGQEAELLFARVLRTKLAVSKTLVSKVTMSQATVLGFEHDCAVSSDSDSHLPKDGMAAVWVTALRVSPTRMAENSLPYGLHSVVLNDVNSFFGEVSGVVETGVPFRAWIAACRLVCQDFPVSPRCLAAYMSMRKTHSSVLHQIALGPHSTGVICKELPDCLGSDLILILPSMSRDGNPIVDICRVQVKMATQKSLALGAQSTAGRDRVFEAVGKFLDTEEGLGKPSAGTEAVHDTGTAFTGASSLIQFVSEKGSLPKTGRVFLGQDRSGMQQHLAACTAIADLVVMATALHRNSAFSTPLTKGLEEHFELTRTKMLFRFHKPVIATTHTIPADTQLAAGKAGVDVLDAQSLSTHWGQLGALCRELGILPFALSATHPAGSDAAAEFPDFTYRPKKARTTSA